MKPVNSTHTALINAGNQTPIYRVKVYETAKTVPSKGFNVQFYTIADLTDAEVNAILNDGGTPTLWYNHGNVTSVLGGSDIIEESSALAFDWGVGGSPAPISQAHLFGIRWYGKFYARYTGVYRFYIDACSFGRLRVSIDGSYLQFKDASAVNKDKWNDDRTLTEELYADTASLTTNTWHDIQIEFAVGRRLEEFEEPAYLCVKYKEPTSATTARDLWGDTGGDIVSDYPADTDRKVLSAGVVIPADQSAFLSGTEITDIIKGISGGGGIDEAAQYEFKVPIAVTTWLTGDVLDSDDEFPVDSTDGFPSKGRLLVGSSDVEVTYTGKTSNSFTGCSTGTAFSEDDRVTLHTGKYSYNPNTRNFGVLRPFRLCSIEFGHRNSAGTAYYSQAVWGHIFPNPVVHRSRNEAYITIYVQDFSNLMMIPMTNFPDQASYSSAGYYNSMGYSDSRTRSIPSTVMTTITMYRFGQPIIIDLPVTILEQIFPKTYIGGLNNEPEGERRPVCYDRWNCETAVRDLMLKANIDPVLTYQRKRLQVTETYATDYGGYLISADFQLNHKPKYGNPDSVDNPDDNYLWFFGYGTKIIEAMSVFAKTFGRRIGFNNEGFSRFAPLGLPVSTLDVKDATVTAFVNKTDYKDYNATTGHYQGSITGGNFVSFPVTGSAFTVLVGRHSGFGSIRIQVDTVNVAQVYVDGEYRNGVSGVFDLDFAGRASSDPWLYFDGLYVGTGENPAEVRIIDTYDYGAHTVKITINAADAGEPFIDAVQCFDRTIDHSIKDITTATVTSDLNTPYDIENVRNDILVVGALVGLFQNSAGQTVNPNNPIYKHIFSRAVDIYSIYDSSNKHYVGRRIPFQIWDDKVNSQEWADYISANCVKKYRPLQFQPPATIPLDMRLEPDDCITVNDLKTKTTLDSDNLWITNVRNNYSKDKDKVKALTTVDVTSRKPIKSFERRGALDIDTDYNSEPIVNIELKSQGKRISGVDITIEQRDNTAVSVDNPNNTVTLDVGASAVDNYYNGMDITMDSETHKVTDYVGSTKVATVDGTPTWSFGVYDMRGITINTDPEWTVDMWAGYLFTIYGANGLTVILNDKIASNTTDKIVLENITLTDLLTFTGDLIWSISFDPFDTDKLNAPLEIHYDQLMTGRIRIYIKDSDDKLVAFVNKETANDIIEWGANKVAYWAGVYETENNYYVKNQDFHHKKGTLKRPLHVYFEVEDMDAGKIYSIVTKISDGYKAGIIKEDDTSFTDMTYVDGCAIFPFNHLAPPVVYLDDGDGSSILYSGKTEDMDRTNKYFELDNDPGIDLTGKYIMVATGDTYNYFEITGYYDGDTTKVTVDTLVPFSVDASGKESGFASNYGDSKYQNKYFAIYDTNIHAKFDFDDNSYKGLNLKLVKPSIYIDGDVLLTLSGTELDSDFNIIYEGTPYNFTTGYNPESCYFKDEEFDDTDAAYDYHVYYWNKHNPNTIYQTFANRTSNVFSPQEDLYEVIQRVNRPRDGLYVLFVSIGTNTKVVYCLPTEDPGYDSGFNVTIVKKDYTIYKEGSDYELCYQETENENFYNPGEFLKIASLQNIYYSPERTGLGWKTLPEGADNIEGINVAQFFIFNLDIKDRAGRDVCNMFLNDFAQRAVSGSYSKSHSTRKIEDDYSYMENFSKIEAINIKTDELYASWYPLGLSGGDFILDKKSTEDELTLIKKYAIKRLYQKIWT